MDDEHWMDLALSEAKKGVGLTSPNPPVGAIIVREGKELGRGYHDKAGHPHAEREAIKNTKEAGHHDLNGATIFVTLEPCSTVGRTSACTEAILSEGITTVVYGAIDPNPDHAGNATTLLEDKGVTVRSGVREQECQQLIRAFAKVQATGMPWVVVKTAMTLDGSITRPPGEGAWLSNEHSREDVQELRLSVDAIMTTGETVRQDDPRLTLRSSKIPEGKEQPWRVILTQEEGRIPKDAQILTDEHADKTIIAAGKTPKQSLSQLSKDKNVNTVLVEAGGAFAGTLFDQGLVDELIVYLAPMLSSGPTPAIGGEGVGSLAERWRLSNISFKQIGSDLRMSGLVAGRGGELER